MNDIGRAEAALLGALVADAAALGLHWIYDVGRIAQVASAAGRAAFVPLDRRHFEGVPAYFAHGNRRDGMLTQYGESLRLAMGAARAEGGYDPAAHLAAFGAHFGPGGTYVGYIDRPTREVLANIAAGRTDPSGVDDDQLPALAAVPAVLAAHRDRPDLWRAAVRVTHANPVADAGAAVLADLLGRVLDGAGVADALAAVAADDGAGAMGLAAALESAATPGADPVAYGEVTGRACHLTMGLPLCFRILAGAEDFAGAVEANIRCGGDSAGRAIVIGAVMGAAHGIDGARGIPLDWILAMHDGAAIWEECRAVALAGR